MSEATITEIEYLADDTVSSELDGQLRALLVCCFTKPEDHVFKERRYFREPYPHRWVIRNAQGIPVAHVGVHEKQVRAGGHNYKIGGIAEVCVHPDFRGRGLVKDMLRTIHAWLRDREFSYAVLMGDPGVYGSSGYVPVDNLFSDDVGNAVGAPTPLTSAMVYSLTANPWPEGDVLLNGPGF